MNLLKTSLSAAVIALPFAGQAATIVSNNTGFPNSNVMVVDNESASGFTNNISGTNGSDGAAGTYGLTGLWSNGGSTTYSFTGLGAGTYNVYATWFANGDTSANGFVANATSLGTVSITAQPDPASGFTAYEETVEAVGDARPFELIGQVTVTGSGLIDVVSTPAGGNGFGRYDAVAVAAAVPEPSTALLTGLAGLGLILRRRK